MPDRHQRRGGDDYGRAIAAALPSGAAWPRNLDSNLMKVVYGCGQIWGFIDARWSDLLETETDPRKTIEMLPDWERNFGLPDPCIQTPQTIGDRQIMLVQRMTLLGSQSRQFFKDLKAAQGFDISITEFSPFVCGLSQCGDTRPVGDTERRVWLANSEATALPAVSGDDTGLENSTLRVVIDPSTFAVTGVVLPALRVRLGATASSLGATTRGRLAHAFMGHKAVSGGEADFDGEPTRVTFNGGHSHLDIEVVADAFGSGEEAIYYESDPVPFDLDVTRPLVLAFYFSNDGAVHVAGEGPGEDPGAVSFYLAGADHSQDQAVSTSEWSRVSGSVLFVSALTMWQHGTARFRWEIGPPEIRFYWSVSTAEVGLSWFFCGKGQCGRDPMCRIMVPQDAECLLERWKPAHTEIVYDFSLVSNEPPPPVLTSEKPSVSGMQFDDSELAVSYSAMPIGSEIVLVNVSSGIVFQTIPLAGGGSGTQTVSIDGLPAGQYYLLGRGDARSHTWYCQSVTFTR